LINTSQILLGQLVVSKAGRDIGKHFIVIKIVDESYVYLVDGDLRKIEKPKKKKIKHVQKTNNISTYITEKLEKNEKITNTMIRYEIEKLDFNSNLG